MSDPAAKSQTNTIWIIAAVGFAAFFFWPKSQAVTPSGNVEATTRNVFVKQASGNQAAFDAAAQRVEAGEIKTDRQLLEYLKPLTQSARLEANKDFDVMFEKNIPDGEFGDKAGDVAAFLRKVAKSWK